ncbi:MAG: sodium:proton antiporter [Gammaproteobacteria bacterium]
MSVFQIIALMLTLAAVFSFLNYKTLKLPTTIGLMFFSLLMSLAIIGLHALNVDIETYAEKILSSIDFNQTLMQGMLSFLLFAGALHVDLESLAKQKWVIASLATIGLLLSTFLVGCASWWILGLLGFNIDLIWCLLFGALISPTDPIAVMAILKTAGAPESLETKIAGESLFNDGVAVVVFIVLLEIATGGHPVTAGHVLVLFAEEAVGGVVYGLVIGYLAFQMLKNVDNYTVEILITLALVSGGYALAGYIHVSGPIAMVVSGLLIGNHGRAFAMSDKTRAHLDTFWELVDEILNAILFVLIGFEILLLSFNGNILIAGMIITLVTLAARMFSVWLPISMLKFTREFTSGVVRILTWGGLRGGISVALALSIPAGPARDIILPITYIIVVFSILVQGLTVGRLIRYQIRA